QEAAYRFLDTLLWESTTDLNMHAILTASLGFCGRHSRQLLTYGGQRLGAAVVERTSLLAALGRLPDLAATVSPPSAWYRLRQPHRKAHVQVAQAGLIDSIQPCPACVREATEEARGVTALLAHLDEFSGPLLDAGGLCLPHFVQTTRAASAPQRAVLLEIEQRVWTDLAEL